MPQWSLCEKLFLKFSQETVELPAEIMHVFLASETLRYDDPKDTFQSRIHLSNSFLGNIPKPALYLVSHLQCCKTA